MRRFLVITLCSSALALGAALSVPPLVAQDTGWRQSAAEGEIQCNEQEPQDFLIRGNWQTTRRMTNDEVRERRAIHQRAIRYRTQTYGFFTGFGQAEWNRATPMQNARGMRAFGLPIRINERVQPALRCAEQEIARSCRDDYQPQRLSGIRDRNTYHNGEVSNHVYGIAIDLDPTRNTCCNCVKEWRLHPLCQTRPRSIFDRMVMPECWVRSFEKFGFYWLGHDTLMDTMHFEFLGDPDHVLRSSGPPPHMSER